MTSQQPSISSSPEEGDTDFFSSLKFQTCLGLGGFGIVLHVIGSTSSNNPTPTAVKLIFPSDENGAKEIFQERPLASTIKHRNIVRILNVGRKTLNLNEIEDIFKHLSPDDEDSLAVRDAVIGLLVEQHQTVVESIWIQMELCGETLRIWLHQQCDKTEEEVQRSQIFQIRICRGIVTGLRYLHDQKIIHRNLKPENVMFSANGFQLPVKIGGRAQQGNPESLTGSLRSRTDTLDYSAPEGISSDYTLQVDLFSLGLVIWEVVQLIRFQDRRALFDALVNHKDVDLIQVPETFSPLRPCIVDLTKKERTDRAQGLDEVVRVLQEVYQNVVEFPRTGEELGMSLGPAEPNFLSSLQFETCLGLGGFGIVLKAHDPATSLLSAVKFILSTDPNEKEVMRECIVAGNLDHENIVKIMKAMYKELDANEIETMFRCVPEDDNQSISFRDSNIRLAKRHQTVGSICIQMELCGETLRQWLNEDHDPNDTKIHATQINIAYDIVAGLKYLHSKNIIHRDLKPENIMFSATGFILPVKIGDFGLCRILHSHQETHTSSLTSRTGTEEYRAPEALTKDYTTQADLFSLGLVLWEVFQLIPFQERRALFDRLVNDRKEELVHDHAVLKGIKQLIVNLTKRNIEDRRSSINSFQEMLETGRDGLRPQYVTSNTELEWCLKNVEPGGRIVLDEGVFQGEVLLETNGVELVGQGPGKTFIRSWKGKACLTVTGNDCIISGMTISAHVFLNMGICLKGSRNRIHNLEISGSKTCIHISGDWNVLEELWISNAEDEIESEDLNNNSTPNEIDIEDREHRGIGALHLSPAVLLNVGIGILVDGSNNRLSHIHIVRMPEGKEFLGVWLRPSGSFNTISNLICSGYSRIKRDWALRMNSTHSSVQDSDCGPIYVNGKESSLSNVDCGEEISIEERVEGVTLTECRGQKLVHQEFKPKPDVITGCHFDKWSAMCQ